MYARNTTVLVERSKAEIERMLRGAGASQFISGWDEGKVMVAFHSGGRCIKITVPMPSAQDCAVTPGRRHRGEAARQIAVQDEERRRWRALVLMIKAKLESVASGIATFEDEFLPYTVMPNGQTVGQWANPQIAAGGPLRPLLGMGEEGKV